jgi:hypothetical protein
MTPYPIRKRMERVVWSRLAWPRLRAEALVAREAQESPHEPNNPVELTAHSARFSGCSWRFRLWVAAHRERSAANDSGEG